MWQCAALVEFGQDQQQKLRSQCARKSRKTVKADSGSLNACLVIEKSFHEQSQEAVDKPLLISEALHFASDAPTLCVLLCLSSHGLSNSACKQGGACINIRSFAARFHASSGRTAHVKDEQKVDSRGHIPIAHSVSNSTRNELYNTAWERTASAITDETCRKKVIQ